LACDQILSLAENHFPDFLSRSVILISDANRLEDRIRERRITADEEDVEIRKLIAAAIKLLRDMADTVPVGRIPLDGMPAEKRATTEARDAQIADEIGGKISPPEGGIQVDADDSNLISFIVQTREPESHGKLVVVQDITKNYSGSPFRLRPISF